LANTGHFVYPFDASYVHLALASQIATGHYGINPGEAAAPSSTIIYPYLVAFVSALGVGQLAPLTINVAATIAIGLLLCELARESGLHLSELPVTSLALLAAALALSTNLIGIELGGLEHSLHVALTVASLLGLVRFLQRRKADWWWLGCIALLPLVRFEAAALAVLDIGLLLTFRKFRHAAVVTAFLIICVGGFGLYLHSLGLPWLPSSVLSKSEVASAAAANLSSSARGGLVVKIVGNLNNNLHAYGGAQIAVMVAALLAVFVRSANPVECFRSDPVKAVVASFAALVSIAHLTGGSLNSYSRYEIYVMALDLCALAVVYREPLNAWLRTATFPAHIIVAVMLVFIFSGYARRTLVTPASATNVYDQSYQLRRFVVQFYHHSVAVNHLGLINYRNPEYVLDLSGRGSEPARRAIATRQPGNWIERLTEASKHDVDLAIIYPNLGPPLPPFWHEVARMDVSGRPHTLPGNTVVFYAREKDEIATIVDYLHRFAPTLPPSVLLTILAPDPAHDLRRIYGAGGSFRHA